MDNEPVEINRLYYKGVGHFLREDMEAFLKKLKESGNSLSDLDAPTMEFFKEMVSIGREV